jgi:hypothetical protein
MGPVNLEPGPGSTIPPLKLTSAGSLNNETGPADVNPIISGGSLPGSVTSNLQWRDGDK